MQKNNNVRFVRIKGKIVPIKVKAGSGSRGGRLRAKKNNKQRIGRAAALAGSIGFMAAPLVSTIPIVSGRKRFIADPFVGFKGKLSGAKAYSKSINMSKQKVVSLSKYKKYRSIYKKYRSIERMPRILKMPTRIFTSMTGASLALIGFGAFTASRGDKQRSRETSALNRARRNKK